MRGLSKSAASRVKSALADMIRKHARFYPHVTENGEQLKGALYILQNAEVMSTLEVARVRQVIELVEAEARKIEYILKECNPDLMLSFLDEGYYQ